MRDLFDAIEDVAPMSLAEIVGNARAQVGLSREVVAAATGIDAVDIAAMEYGNLVPRDAEALEALARALQVDAEELRDASRRMATRDRPVPPIRPDPKMALRLSVLQNLHAILNARRGWLFHEPLFGMPDEIASAAMQGSADLQAIVTKSLIENIERFEPRVDHRTVSVVFLAEPDVPADETRFEIRATLRDRDVQNVTLRTCYMGAAPRSGVRFTTKLENGE